MTIKEALKALEEAAVAYDQAKEKDINAEGKAYHARTACENARESFMLAGGRLVEVKKVAERKR